MSVAVEGAGRGGVRLWAEFIGLFVLAPLALAVLLPPSAMFPVLFGVTLVGMVLLHRTPGFAWADLLSGWRGSDLWLVAGFALATVLTAGAVVLWTAPEAFLGLARQSPLLLLMILLLYPILSALPQELVFRPLYFRRYGALLPSGGAGIVLNAAVFSLAHLMYWSWIVLAMTFFGGLVFAWAYEVRRSFPLAVVLHAVAGWILFTLGLGVYFYSGNVVRPF